MCHTAESGAPAPPVHGAVADCGDVFLPLADGHRTRVHHAVPAVPNGRSVVVLPDVRGLHPFYEDLVRRFAEAGFAAAAVDFYGRTAETADRGADFDWRSHLPGVTAGDVDATVEAAASFLRTRTHGPVFTVGFCFGGGHSWRLAATGSGLAGTIGFYGLPHLVEDNFHRGSAPLLMLLAEHDDETPQRDYDALAERLAKAGARYEIHTYLGASHSFFDRSSHRFQGICADAWQRVLDFTGRYGDTSPQEQTCV